MYGSSSSQARWQLSEVGLCLDQQPAQTYRRRDDLNDQSPQNTPRIRWVEARETQELAVHLTLPESLNTCAFDGLHVKVVWDDWYETEQTFPLHLLLGQVHGCWLDRVFGPIGDNVQECAVRIGSYSSVGGLRFPLCHSGRHVEDDLPSKSWGKVSVSMWRFFSSPESASHGMPLSDEGLALTSGTSAYLTRRQDADTVCSGLIKLATCDSDARKGVPTTIPVQYREPAANFEFFFGPKENFENNPSLVMCKAQEEMAPQDIQPGETISPLALPAVITEVAHTSVSKVMTQETEIAPATEQRIDEAFDDLVDMIWGPSSEGTQYKTLQTHPVPPIASEKPAPDSTRSHSWSSWDYPHPTHVFVEAQSSPETSLFEPFAKTGQSAPHDAPSRKRKRVEESENTIQVRQVGAQTLPFMSVEHEATASHLPLKTETRSDDPPAKRRCRRDSPVSSEALSWPGRSLPQAHNQQQQQQQHYQICSDTNKYPQKSASSSSMSRSSVRQQAQLEEMVKKRESIDVRERALAEEKRLFDERIARLQWDITRERLQLNMEEACVTLKREKGSSAASERPETRQ